MAGAADGAADSVLVRERAVLRLVPDRAGQERTCQSGAGRAAGAAGRGGGGAGVAGAQTVEVRRLLGRPVALLRAGERPPVVYDLTAGRQLSPIPMAMTAQIAEADHAGDLRASRVSRITEETTDYRAALPVWR